MTYPYPYEYQESASLDEFGQLWYFPPVVANRNRYFFTGDNPNKPANIMPQIFYENSVVIDESFNDLECFLYGFRWMYTIGEFWYWGYAIPSSDKRYVGSHVIPNNRSLSCAFQCPYGYYVTNIQNIWGVTLCGICDDSCYECYGPGIDNCKSCKYKTDSLKINLVRFPIGNGTCSANNCASNEYLLDSVCVECDPNCDSCNAFICLVCADGHFLVGTTCVACSTNCKTCNSQGCLVCLQPFVNHTLSYSLSPQTIPLSFNGSPLESYSKIDYSCLPTQMSTYLGITSSASLTTTNSNTQTLTSTNYLTTTIANTNSLLYSTSSDFSDSLTISFSSSTTTTNTCISTTATIINSHFTTTYLSTIQNHHPVVVYVNNTFQNTSNYYDNTFIQPIYFNYQCTQSVEIDFVSVRSTLTNSMESQTTESIVFEHKFTSYITPLNSTHLASNTQVGSTFATSAATFLDLPTAQENSLSISRISSSTTTQLEESNSIHQNEITSVSLYSETQLQTTTPESTSFKFRNLNSQSAVPLHSTSFIGGDASVLSATSGDTASTQTITTFVTLTATTISNISSQALNTGLPTSLVVALTVMSVFLCAIIVVLMIWSRKSIQKYKVLKHSPTVPLNCIIRNFEEFKIATHLIKPIEKISQCGIFEMTFGKLLLPNDKNMQVVIRSIDKSDEYMFAQEVELYCKVRGVTKVNQFIGYCETPTKNLIIYAHYEMTLSDWFLSPATNLLTLTDYQYQVKLIVPQIIIGLTAMHAMRQFHGNVGLQAVYIQSVGTMAVVVGELRIKPTLSQNEVDQPIYARYLNSKILKQFSKGFQYKYGETDDIFAFGILVYELVHGEKAYCDLNLGGTLQKIENEEYPVYTLQLYADMYQKCMENTAVLKDFK